MERAHVDVWRRALIGGALLASLAACGGGGGGAAASPSPPGGWVAGQFLPAASFADRCAAPRTGLDSSGRPFPDIQGTVLDENNWLRSWSNHLYLWYDEITDRDPSGFTDPLTYFDLLKTTSTTASGNPKDRFHFTFGTAEWLSLSQSGVSAGYGFELAILRGSPPREIVIAFTEPSTPATAPGVDLARGARIIGVDGFDAVNGNTQAVVDALNAGLFPRNIGETHQLDVRDLGSQVTRSVSLTAAEITSTPVQNVGTVMSPSGATVGYLLFNDHIATAEAALKDAVETLAAASIEDLIIDIRYNGGGFLAIAAELAYMIAGDAATVGRTFEELQFNDKHPTTNPVTGAPLGPLPFADTTVLADTPEPLPTLDLPRVFVLTGPDTCSASESIINSLRGIGVEVIQVGSGTCGKPYGFYPDDNCGTTYFSIQFRGINAAGFGDYADGFRPADASTGTDTELPGCSVDDDFDHALGDPAEALLATALMFRDGNTCPPASIPFSLETTGAPAGPYLVKPPWRSNRILSD